MIWLLILHNWEQSGYVRQPLRCTHHSFRVLCKLVNNYLFVFPKLMSDICKRKEKTLNAKLNTLFGLGVYVHTTYSLKLYRMIYVVTQRVVCMESTGSVSYLS